jgi:2-aminomuconate deaminase
MAIENKTIENKAKPLGNYPHVKKVGNFIFVSGTSSRRKDDTHVGAVQLENGDWVLDIEAQTKAVIENIAALLQSVNADLSHLIEVSTFLVDMKDFTGYNKVYGTYFNSETGPTRTTVAVHQLPHPNLLIEIKAIGYIE